MTSFLRSRLKSFGYAFKGLASSFYREPNMWIHLSATIAVLIGVVYFSVSKSELLALLLATGMVWIAEIFNTAIEHIMDFISKEKRAEIKLIKDLAAAAVLLSAIIAVVTGLLVFLPKLV